MDPDGISAIALVAERKILEAMAEGQFDNLPGRGHPLKLDDLSNLPPELRLAYMVLKNSGHLEASAETDKIPPAGLAGLLSQAGEEGRECGKLERLRFRLSRARRAAAPSRFRKPAGPEDLSVAAEPAPIAPRYLEKLLKKF